MGWKLKRIDLCNIKPNEEKDLEICLEEENRAAIHGVVKFPDGRPVKNAVVKLFLKKGGKCDNYCDLVPVTFAFTDKCGQFLFGVKSCKEYVIKIFFYIPEEQPKPCPPKGGCCICDDLDC